MLALQFLLHFLKSHFGPVHMGKILTFPDSVFKGRGIICIKFVNVKKKEISFINSLKPCIMSRGLNMEKIS